ncbi:ankyrin repeat domain-containing protein [Faecalibacter sp. LW9]|uniref:ankyrin repeat domain-containing protein n=1 Tax=Faecalibacter sp. LW9 TaxID=3103144 RepID=UPI002AFDCA41|nr:ankyrin repeat domain-containing protein [Faecalibacter sp. LW9]
MKGFFLLLLFILNSVVAFAHKEKWDENKVEWSPLMIAIYNSNNDKVREFIGQNTNINFITSGKHSNWRLTALDVAIYIDNEYAAELLLLTNKISKPERFLMTASKQQSTNTVLLLLKYGANPNETLSNGLFCINERSKFWLCRNCRMFIK